MTPNSCFSFARRIAVQIVCHVNPVDNLVFCGIVSEVFIFYFFIFFSHGSVNNRSTRLQCFSVRAFRPQKRYIKTNPSFLHYG